MYTGVVTIPRNGPELNTIRTTRPHVFKCLGTMSASRDHIAAYIYSKSQQPSKAPFAAYKRSTVLNLGLKTVELMPSSLNV